jgi:Tfp pilus assembly protein PilV
MMIITRTRTDARGGFTVLEILVASAMLMLLLAMSAQALVQVRRFQRKADERVAAVELLENALEELTSKPWDEINDQAIGSLKLPADVVERWPDMRISGSVSTTAEPVEGKRIMLSLESGASNSRRAPSLTTWVYRKAPG